MEQQIQDSKAWRTGSKIDKSSGTGKLKIFFGYAAGVGKTYAMLEAAHVAKKSGIDIVIGYIEPHARPETNALTQGLEILPKKQIEYRGVHLEEFDLDNALRRRPQLILVDELAHTNAAGSRHPKRYHDVKELLRAGINVYTTVNVQHLESLNDMVSAITKIKVNERIPDKLFDQAAKVELVDIEPEELIARLREGKVYREKQAEQAVEHFFTVENLTALREIAMRRCADRMNRLREQELQTKDFHVREHLLICLSSSPSNEKVIRTAARMANVYHGEFTALYVETPDQDGDVLMQDSQFKRNLKLAHQLGAHIATVSGDDVAFQIAEYAKSRNVSQIILGRTNSHTSFFPKASLVEKLTEYAPDMDIYIIPDRVYQPKPRHPVLSKTKLSVWDFSVTSIILSICTLIGLGFYHAQWNEANIVLIFILGILLISVMAKERLYSVVSCVISVLVFNYFFTEPRFTLNAYAPEYPLTFLIMLIVALTVNSMTTRLKKQARLSAMKSRRTEVLLETDHMLQMAKNMDEIMHASCRQIAKLLNRLVIFYPAADGTLEAPIFSNAFISEEEKTSYTNEFEHNVAEWVLKNQRSAGASTNTLPASKVLYFAVRTDDETLAVVGIAMEKQGELPEFERSILISMLNETAFALEKSVLNEAKKKIAMEAEKERLRANLLRAISHDLRTPLTSISGNADILLKNGIALSDDVRHQIYDDIYHDAEWLKNLVENLLAITKAENGNMQLSLHGELLEDVINEALQHLDRRSVDHIIKTHIPDDMLMAKVDPKLIVQVIINLVDNAIKYTQKGSQIEITAVRHADLAVVEVIDNGPGIADADQEAIFDMFYTADNETGDRRRGLGLGLALCKSIVEAHGGKIYVLDNYPKGTIFGFTLQIEEVRLHEESDDSRCGG